MGFKFNTPKTKEKDTFNRGPLKKNIARWKWYLIAIILISPFIFLFWHTFSSMYFISAKGYLKMGQYVVKSPEDGYVSKIFVKTSDNVTKGSPLIQIRSSLLELKKIELTKQLSSLEEQQLAMDTQQDKLEEMKIFIDSYVKQIKSDFQEYQKYKDKGLLSLLEYEALKEEVFRAEVQAYDIRRIINQNKVQQIINSEMNFLKVARAINLELKLLNERLSELKIFSLGNGNVISIDSYEGEFVRKGQALMSMTDTSPPFFKAYLEAKYLEDVQKGDKVSVVFPDGYKVPGIIANDPSFTLKDPNTNYEFKSNLSKVILIIKPQKNIQKKYIIFNAPVKIKFN